MSTRLHPPYQSQGVQKKQQRQKRDCHRASLIKKAYKLSTIYKAKVCLGIIIKNTGQVFIFCSNPKGIWQSFISHLVYTLLIVYSNCCCETNPEKKFHYPVLCQITSEDFIDLKGQKTQSAKK